VWSGVYQKGLNVIKYAYGDIRSARRKNPAIFLETSLRRAEYLAIETGELTSPSGRHPVRYTIG